jgi:ATP-dependent helicase/nuclease subunit B
LDAAIDGLEQRDVLRFLKSALSPLDPEICDKIENYAILWGIRRDKWNQEWTLHPGGLGGEWSDRDRENLAKLNEARLLGVEPLARLRSGLLRASSLAEQVQALYRFLEEINLSGKLERMAMEADGWGDNRTAQEFNQLWEILLSAMEQLIDVMGTSKWEPEAFSRLFRLLLSQYDVGTIPTVLDVVSVGPVSAMRCQQVEHLFVLGASEGLLPSYAGSAGVLTDQERTELRRLGVPLTGGAMEGVAAEFAEIYGCFCGADQTIRLSCSSCTNISTSFGRHSAASASK